MSAILEEYFSERLRKLFQSLETFKEKSDEDSLHDVRVEVKKLKSMRLFLKQVYPDKTVRRKKLRKLFSEAGMIRVFQLNLSWLKKNKFHLLIEKGFHEDELRNQIHQFQSKISQAEKDLQKDFDEWKELIEKTDIKIISNFCLSLLNELKTLLCNSDNNEVWHELRKEVKRFLHVQNWNEPFSSKDFLVSLDKLQELLGNWHDLVVINETLLSKQLYLSENKLLKAENAKAVKKIANASTHLERKIKALLEEVNSLLQKVN